jgi:Zn-dependent M28 family amino/carboxypeptidase
VKVLASDEFEGRAPGTPGEAKATAYIAEQMKKAGLKPAGPNGSWFQDVPFVETRVDGSARFEVAAASGRASFEPRKDFVLWSMRPDSVLADSPLIFVGYGITAPERDWDDFAGIDVRGKTIVVLVNDPGSADPTLFDGKAMTYYGRWTYKLEEAARRGAAGALVVHDTETASYPWSVVVTSWTGPRLDIAQDGNGATHPAVEGWITTDMARSMFKLAGHDFDVARAAAATRGFKPFELGARAGIDLKARSRTFLSRNVAGILPGTDHAGETLLYTAHWDHFGTGKEGEIFHGALDNASGVAGLLGLAERFAHDKHRPRRSVLFVAVTGEEYGLLGSAWYAAHPLRPLATTVADINMDVLSANGPTRDVVVTGQGKVPDLEAMLGLHASNQARYVEADPHPETGGFFRSDQFNLAKVGVPVLAARGGVDNREHGREWGEAQRRDYVMTRYHRPADAWSADTDWRGAIQDLDLYYSIGRDLVDRPVWPRWSPSAEFARARSVSEILRR